MAVIAAGSLLSSLSNAVCMVSLLLKSSCLCHLNPRNKKHAFFIKKKKKKDISHTVAIGYFFGITDALFNIND